MSLGRLFFVGVLAVLTVWVTSLIWRDMRHRNRPVWLRVFVIVTGFVTGLGILVWIFDYRKHPHDPKPSLRDFYLQRYDCPDRPN